jgi:kynurenine/2-aminoadipate aminotransferase
MNAEYLNRVLSNWSDPNNLPKVIYTIPNGSNPTGASMSLERKKDIYSVGDIFIELN